MEQERSTPTDEVHALAFLHVVADNLFERPDPQLDIALDAAANCFSRHGLAHTSVRDIAAELGVSKATVYRQVGSIDDLARALLAREAHRLVDEVTRVVGGRHGPDATLSAIITAAGVIGDHPVVHKIMTDEPALLVGLVPNLPAIVDAIMAALTQVIDVLRPDTPDGSAASVVAEIAVHVVLATILVPNSDRDALLRRALAPHLGT